MSPTPLAVWRRQQPPAASTSSAALTAFQDAPIFKGCTSLELPKIRNRKSCKLVKQIEAIKRVITLLCPVSGSLLIGRQVGQNDPQDPDNKMNYPTYFRHYPATWKGMWEQIEQETGMRWQVESLKESWEGARKGYSLLLYATMN